MESRRVETPEALEGAAEELVRLANEHARDPTVAGDLCDLAEKYMRRADELRVLMGQRPKRPLPERPDSAAASGRIGLATNGGS
jgi:hypothetical protein